MFYKDFMSFVKKAIIRPSLFMHNYHLHIFQAFIYQVQIYLIFFSLYTSDSSLTAIVFTPVVEHQQLLEEDTKPLIESGFCDSIVSFGDFIDLDLGRDLDREEDEEEDIPPLVDSGLTLAPLVQYSYAVPNIVEYIEQVETDNVSTICGMSRDFTVYSAVYQFYL